MSAKNSLIEKYTNEKDYNNLLLNACKFNDVEAFELAMAKNANVNYKNEFGVSPLMCAMLVQNINMCKVLANAGADFSAKDTNGNNLYHYALGLDYKVDKEDLDEKDTFKCVKLIASNQKDNISCQNAQMVSPLHLACNLGYGSVVECLLSNGANPNLCDAKGDSPLAKLYMSKAYEFDDLLYDYGADVNVNEWQRHSVLFRILSSNISEDKKRQIADKLIDKGATIEAMQLEYLIDDKIAKGIEEYAQKLMRKQLIRKIENKQDSVAKKFVSREEYLALYEYFIGKKNYKDAKLLIQMGLSINAQNRSNGDTRLIKAVKDNDFEYVKFLVENKASVNIRNKEGKSATEYAIDGGLKNIALYLLEHNGRIYVDKPTFEKCKEKMGEKYEDLLHRRSVIFLGNKAKKTGIYANNTQPNEKN